MDKDAAKSFVTIGDDVVGKVQTENMVKVSLQESNASEISAVA